ncbi:MAG: hypothetical protein ACRDTH_06555 [Pseudonocardiaceae bacterium]
MLDEQPLDRRTQLGSHVVAHRPVSAHVAAHDRNQFTSDAREDVLTLLGHGRLVLTPATDDPELLRTVIQLLRISALTASSREDRDGIHTADEKITDALGMLGKIDDIKKVAGTLRQNTGKIEQQSDDLRTALTRLLSQAQSALSVAAEATHNAA